MERVVFKFSDFIKDDGAFDEALKKVDEFGEKIVASAKKTQAEFKKNLNLENTEAVAKYEKEAEKLTESFKKQIDARESLLKIEKEVNKRNKTSIKQSEEQIESLVKLDKELQSYRSKLAEINVLQKQNIKTDRDLNKEKVETEINIKKVRKEIALEQKEILKKTELSRKEKKIVEANIILQRTEIKNREELRERIKALRIVVDNLDFESQGDQIQAYNQEIDELTDKLSENSDKFIQSKINIGNYEEAVVSALKSTSFFSGELSFLNSFIEKGIDFFNRSAEANNTDAKAKNANTKATSRLSKGIGTLNKVAKATIILALVAAIASLASVFGQGRSGAIATARATARLQVTLRTLLDVGSQVGKGLFKIFGSIGTSFGRFFDGIELTALNLEKRFLQLTNAFSRNDAAISSTTSKIRELENELKDGDETNYAEGWKQITEAIGGASKQISEATAAINTLDQAAIRAFQIADEIKLSELNLIALRKEVSLLDIESGDSTRSLTQQLEATDKLLTKRVELLTAESNVSRQNLELANAKARADAERLGFNLSQDEVKFAEELLALNIRLDETRGENDLDDTFLEDSQNALKAYKEALNEIEIAEKETAKTRREIQRDLFEQNLDLLIDLIDTEKNLSEQFVNDTTKNFKDRINEFNRFLIKFRETTSRQLDEFNKQAENAGFDVDFNIEYDEDGNFEVFLGDTKLAANNIVELNKQLQATGLGEIEINRFREFIIETRNGVRDFRDLNKELSSAGISIRQLRSDVSVSDDELNALDKLDEKIFELRKKSSGRISSQERNDVLEQLKKFEEERTAIVEFAEEQRLSNRVEAINDELKTVQDGSERFYELLEERNQIEKQLRDKSAQDQINTEEEKQKKIVEQQKKAATEIRSIISSVLDSVVDSQNKQVEKAVEASDKQKELVDKQQERAQQGLENTLAFEQRELGKREAQRIKEEKQRERLEKIKALYASYSNYASQGDGDNAIVKALRDFAVLEAIQASFGDGGIVEDVIGKTPTDGKGIIRGRSHKGNGGGIPILVEGREGIFSAREMDNLGKDNFYKMKEIASLGKVDSNIFSKQNKQLVSGVKVSVPDNGKLISEMRDVKRAIENKPSSRWDVRTLVDGTFELIETITSKNSTKRNIHKVKKSRL